MTTFLLYGAVIVFYLISFLKDRKKTKSALLAGIQSFENIMPQFLGIIFVVGIILTILSPENISSIIGEESGALGVITAAIIGSLTLVPTFVAFSTTALLLENGAGYTQITALISAFMFVGIFTFTMEAKFIGKKATAVRNVIYFVYSIVSAFIVGAMMR
ncbi:permease [Clostridium sp. Marseille-QA1073]